MRRHEVLVFQGVLLVLLSSFSFSLKEFNFNNGVRRTTKSRGVNGGNALFDPETGEFKRNRPTLNKDNEDLEIVNRARLMSLKSRENPDTKPVLNKVLRKRKIIRKPVYRSSGEHKEEKEEEDSSPSETISSGLKKKNVEYKTSDSWRNSRNQNRNKISRERKEKEEKDEKDEELSESSSAPNLLPPSDYIGIRPAGYQGLRRHPEKDTWNPDQYKHFDNPEEVLLRSGFHTQDLSDELPPPSYDYTIGDSRNSNFPQPSNRPNLYSNHQIFPTPFPSSSPSYPTYNYPAGSEYTPETTFSPFPGIYFPPKDGEEKNPFSYDFTIGGGEGGVESEDVSNPILSYLNKGPVSQVGNPYKGPTRSPFRNSPSAPTQTPYRNSPSSPSSPTQLPYQRTPSYNQVETTESRFPNFPSFPKSPSKPANQEKSSLPQYDYDEYEDTPGDNYSQEAYNLYKRPERANPSPTLNPDQTVKHNKHQQKYKPEIKSTTDSFNSFFPESFDDFSGSESGIGFFSSWGDKITDERNPKREISTEPPRIKLPSPVTYTTTTSAPYRSPNYRSPVNSYPELYSRNPTSSPSPPSLFSTTPPQPVPTQFTYSTPGPALYSTPGSPSPSSFSDQPQSFFRSYTPASFNTQQHLELNKYTQSNPSQGYNSPQPTPRTFPESPEYYEQRLVQEKNKVQAYQSNPLSYQHTPTPQSYQPTPQSYQQTPQSSQPTPQSYQPTPQSYQPTPKSYQPAPQTYQYTTISSLNPAQVAYSPTAMPKSFVNPSPGSFYNQELRNQNPFIQTGVDLRGFSENEIGFDFSGVDSNRNQIKRKAEGLGLPMKPYSPAITFLGEKPEPYPKENQEKSIPRETAEKPSEPEHISRSKLDQREQTGKKRPLIQGKRRNLNDKENIVPTHRRTDGSRTDTSGKDTSETDTTRTNLDEIRLGGSTPANLQGAPLNRKSTVGSDPYRFNNPRTSIDQNSEPRLALKNNPPSRPFFQGSEQRNPEFESSDRFQNQRNSGSESSDQFQNQRNSAFESSDRFQDQRNPEFASTDRFQDQRNPIHKLQGWSQEKNFPPQRNPVLAPGSQGSEQRFAEKPRFNPNSGYSVNVFNKSGGRSYTIVDGVYGHPSPNQNFLRRPGPGEIRFQSQGVARPPRGLHLGSGSEPKQSNNWSNDKHWKNQLQESREISDSLPFLL